jgi:hypothetical protein
MRHIHQAAQRVVLGNMAIGSIMSLSRKTFAGAACLGAIALVTACGPARVPPPTVSDLMDDRVALDGILMKCNRHGDVSLSDEECGRARAAVERLAHASEAAEAAKRAAEFEKSRESLRLAQERQRQQQEAATKVDPYNLPVIPVDPAPPAEVPKPPAPANAP